MTLYFLFEYDAYYPSGGFNDLTKIFESEDDAIADLVHRENWADYANVYSLKNYSDEPELLYHTFYVLDVDNSLWFVFGNEKRKVIRLTVSNLGAVDVKFWGSTQYTKMSDCEMIHASK